eukprot:COSAG02_NODE_185_length_30442_cov_59.370168_26_plen_149_part_00
MRATLLLQHAVLIITVCCADASQHAAGGGFCSSFRPLPASVGTHLPSVGQTVYQAVCDYLDPTPAPRLSLNRWTPDAEAKLLPVGQADRLRPLHTRSARSLWSLSSIAGPSHARIHNDGQLALQSCTCLMLLTSACALTRPSRLSSRA